MSNGDHHGPHVGCTYQECGNPESLTPCPFVKDEATTSLSDIDMLLVAPHQHEYVLVCSCGDVKPIRTPNRENEL